jgi:signal peptidase I
VSGAPAPGAVPSRWREWRGFVAFIAVMLLFRSAVADWNQVPSGSMLPSILVGDRIVVDKLAYDLRLPFTMIRLLRWQDPARGEVVTFLSPEDERLLVKRVVGLPGDLVEMSDNRLTINGVAADYQPLDPGEPTLPTSGLPLAGYRYYRETLPGSFHGETAHRPSSPNATAAAHSHTLMWRESAGDPFLRNFAPVRVPDDHYLMLGDNRDASRDSRAIGFVARDRIVGKATRVAFSLDYDNLYAPRLERFLANLP